MRTENQRERASSSEHLLHRYLPLVRKSANRFAERFGCPQEVSELVGAGVEALVSTLGEIGGLAPDHELAVLRGRIHSAMIRHMQQVDHLSRGQRRQLLRLERCERDLETRLGRGAFSSELAQAFGVPIDRVFRIRAYHYDEVPIEARPTRIFEDHASSGGTVGEILDSGDKDPLAVLLSAEDSLLLEAALDRLPDKEHAAVVGSFYDELTLKQIGDLLGVTEARASQLRSAGLRRIRKFLQKI